MSERAAIRLLREQLDEAWLVNEHLVGRIEELKSRLARYEKEKTTTGDDSIARTLRASPDTSRQSARVFRWPKQQNNKRIIKIRDKGPDVDDEIVATPVRTVYRSFDRMNSRSSPSCSSPDRPTATIEDTLNDTNLTRFDSDTEIITTPTNKSQNKNGTPAKISKPTIPHVSPIPRPIRIEKTATGVRMSTKSPRPSSRRRIMKAILPDETVNQSGVISDSPARTKRQAFRI